jgi:hypothetical protein
MMRDELLHNIDGDLHAMQRLLALVAEDESRLLAIKALAELISGDIGAWLTVNRARLREGGPMIAPCARA